MFRCVYPLSGHGKDLYQIAVDFGFYHLVLLIVDAWQCIGQLSHQSQQCMYRLQSAGCWFLQVPTSCILPLKLNSGYPILAIVHRNSFQTLVFGTNIRFLGRIWPSNKGIHPTCLRRVSPKVRRQNMFIPLSLSIYIYIISILVITYT